MKKSNKLLLGGFLAVILIITGIHIALYANYKNGNYTLRRKGEERLDSNVRRFQGIRSVRIQNVFSTTISFGDVTTVEKVNEHLIKIRQQGDSLSITGQYIMNDQVNNRFPVNITLPYNATIVADSISMISVLSQDLLKAKITIVPNNP